MIMSLLRCINGENAQIILADIWYVLNTGSIPGGADPNRDIKGLT